MGALSYVRLFCSIPCLKRYNTNFFTRRESIKTCNFLFIRYSLACFGFHIPAYCHCLRTVIPVPFFSFRIFQESQCQVSSNFYFQTDSKSFFHVISTLPVSKERAPPILEVGGVTWSSWTRNIYKYRYIPPPLTVNCNAVMHHWIVLHAKNEGR